MTSSNMRIIVAAAAALGIEALCHCTAGAAEIAYFNFGSETAVPTMAATSSVTPPSGITVSTLGIDPSFTQGTYDNGGNQADTALSYYDTHSIAAGDLATSVSYHDDLQITITPQAGHPLTITSIKLDGFNNGGSGNATTLTTYIVDSVNGTSAPDGSVADENFPGTPTTFSTFTGLSGLTSPVTFYFYSTGVGPYVDKGIHSLEIDGSAVPEPSALGLLGVASIGIMALRRRRSAGIFYPGTP